MLKFSVGVSKGRECEPIYFNCKGSVEFSNFYSEDNP